MATQPAPKTVQPWKQPTVLEAYATCMNAAAEMGLSKIASLCVFSQAGLECTWFTSPVFQKNWNAVGMKMPSKRKSPYIIGKGTPGPPKESYAGDPYNFYAKYANLSDCIKDVIHLQNGNGINWSTITSADAYVDFCIKVHYFQGPAATYRTNVNFNVRKYSKIAVPAVATVTGLGGALLAITALAYFLILK